MRTEKHVTGKDLKNIMKEAALSVFEGVIITGAGVVAGHFSRPPAPQYQHPFHLDAQTRETFKDFISPDGHFVSTFMMDDNAYNAHCDKIVNQLLNLPKMNNNEQIALGGVISSTLIALMQKKFG